MKRASQFGPGGERRRPHPLAGPQTLRVRWRRLLPTLSTALPTGRSPLWCRHSAVCPAASSPPSHQSDAPPGWAPLLTSDPPRTVILNLNSHPPCSYPPFIPRPPPPRLWVFSKAKSICTRCGFILRTNKYSNKQTARQNQRVGVRTEATRALGGRLGLLPSSPTCLEAPAAGAAPSGTTVLGQKGLERACV